MKNVLYISYDGMTDPLGQSQVIPYLAALVKESYRITVLSAEKPDNYSKNRLEIENLMQASNLEWVPIMYTKRPPVLSTIIDILKMRKAVKKLMRKTNFDIVHCRSYISPLAGNILVKKQNASFLFDMRGFWADERIDGGIWSLKNPVLKRVYNYFKKKEKSYLEKSDAVVSLTHNGKNEILSWKHVEIDDEKIIVIPCAADFEHFNIPSEEMRRVSRKKLGVENDELVFCYLGSLGTWYLVDEMLQLFATISQKYSNARLLIITRDELHQNIKALGVNPSKITVQSASRKEVPELLAAADIGISFIKPSFSKKSSSPTKMGEMLAMGIPMIVNDNVGDVAEITQELNAGWVIRNMNNAGFEEAVEQIPDILKLNKEQIRSNASKVLNLEIGVARYLNIYDNLIK